MVLFIHFRGLTDLVISKKEFNLEQYKQCCRAELKEWQLKCICYDGMNFNKDLNDDI